MVGGWGISCEISLMLLDLTDDKTSLVHVMALKLLRQNNKNFISQQTPHNFLALTHDDVIKWKHFLHYWPFVRETTGHWWIPSQRPVTWSFEVFFDLHLNKRFSKQFGLWWFETPSCSLWRHCNEVSSHEWAFGCLFGIIWRKLTIFIWDHIVYI